MKISYALLSLLGLSLSMACGRMDPPQVSEQKIDINIPYDDVDPADLSEVLNTADTVIVEGVRTIPFRELTAQIVVDPTFQATFDGLIASRDPEATIECRGRKCKVVSTGRDFSFKADGIQVPVLGSPTIMLGKNITIYFEFAESRDRLEICRIDGLKAKAGLFVQNIEGGLLEVEAIPLSEAPVAALPAADEAPAAGGFEGLSVDPQTLTEPVAQNLNAIHVTEIKTLLIDAGTGGSYPTNSCMF